MRQQRSSAVVRPPGQGARGRPGIWIVEDPGSELTGVGVAELGNQAHERDNTGIKAETLQIVKGAEANAEIATQVRLLEEQIRLLGRDHVANERFINLLTEMDVPEFIGADASQILQYMPLQRALDLVSQARNRSEPPAEVERQARHRTKRGAGLTRP